jgi:Flp pilus assembly pilin Flp
MNRNHLILSHLLQDTSGADLIEYGLIAVAFILAVVAAESTFTIRIVREINVLAVLGLTSLLTAVVGFVLPLSAAIKGH